MMRMVVALLCIRRDGVGKSAVLRAMAQAGDVGEAVRVGAQYGVEGVAGAHAVRQAVFARASVKERAR